MAVWGDGERSDGVGMAFEGVNDGLFAQIPYTYVVVDAAAVKLVAGFGEGDGRTREVRGDEVEGSFLARIPQLVVQDFVSRC